jgi:S-sulfo-L-cysteine synthase (3-phospho-L-serine-dependent)
MSHFVFLESNTTGTGRIAIERLLATGERVTFVTRSREKYPFLAQPAPGLQVIDLETNDASAATACVAQIDRSAKVDALLTFSDFYVDIVAEVAALLGLRSLGLHPARICRNKFLTRQALCRAGLPTPDFWRVGSAEELRLLTPRLRFPAVVKPPADSSSFGVRIVGDAAELLAHFRTLSAQATNVRGQRLDGTVLVESYLGGPEHSVETVTLPGGATRVVGVTDKHLSPPPHCVETGHDFPSALEPAQTAALAEAALQALAAVRFDFGPAHTEVRWTAEGPVVVEINPRLAGGMIPELVRHATGIDLLTAWLDLLLGREVRLEPLRSAVAGIRFLTADRPGRLLGLQGIEAARQLPTVCEVVLARPAGTIVQPAENAYHRLGHALAAGPDRAQVSRDLERARALLRVHVEEVEEVDAAVRAAPA